MSIQITYSPGWGSLETTGTQIFFVPFEQIQTSYERFRTGMVQGRNEELSDLPIRVVAIEKERFEVIDGFKRLERWRLEGCQTIPVIIERSGPSSAHKRMLLEANAPLRTLTPLDEGLVVEALITEDRLSPAAVAKLLGQKKEWVVRRLAFAKDLSRDAAECLANRGIGPTMACHLTSLPHGDQDEVLIARRKHGLNNRETILLIQALRVVATDERRNLLNNPLATVRPPPSPTRSPRLVELERQIEQMAQVVERFGTLTFPPILLRPSAVA